METMGKKRSCSPRIRTGDDWRSCLKFDDDEVGCIVTRIQYSHDLHKSSDPNEPRSPNRYLNS
uniref:Uncharacterized protein n=1 Tax=Romanomermis culicivorax TaxID=13658 RepID=A0A915JGJ8_ROMCU